MIRLAVSLNDLSIVKDFNGGWLSVKDEIWIEQEKCIRDEFLYYVLDCRSMLIDLRLSLCGNKNLHLPSDTISGRKCRIGGIAEIIIKNSQK